MAEKYYQKYGPVRRRAGEDLDELPVREPAVERLAHRRLPDERPPRRPPHARGSRRPPRRSLIKPLLVFLLLVGVAIALPYTTSVLTGHEVLQGVSIGGQPVGGMNSDEVATLLQQRYVAFVQQPVTLTFEGRTWSPTLAELGAQLDVEQTAAAAVATTRVGSPLQRGEELWALWRRGIDVAPRVKIDARALQNYLSSLAYDINSPPRNAALSVAEGKVLPTSAYTGRQMLVDATTTDILQALQTLQPQAVALRTRPLTPTLTNEGIKPAIADAQLLLSSPLTLQHGARSWTWEPAKIAELLTTTTSDGQMQVEIDEERLARAVEKLAQVTDSGSVEPRLAFNGGSLVIVQPGQIGWKLNQEQAVTAISAALHIPSTSPASGGEGTRTLALPMEEISPQITPETLGTLGIVELVAEGRSSFAGSAQYRITNIKAGAARMDGVLIPPDSEFSFNTQLGEVDEANGFVQGYAVIGNRTQLEWGGGVCQVSTTVFRAMFWAGLPNTEWHAHPFYISWYDAFSFPDQAAPGLDAAIFTGVNDLKFVNDTGHWLLMETWVDEANQVLTVQLYGTKPNREVRVRGPEIGNIVPPPAEPVYVNDPSVPSGTVKQTDVARKGMDIAVERVIVENGVEQEPELFLTRFKAWPNVYVRGTG